MLKYPREARIFFIYRYFKRKITDFLCFSIISKVLYFSIEKNFMKMHVVGPTLIPSRPRIVRSTLKKSATLIAFLPRHEVVDAYSARRQLLSDEYSK